MAELPSEESDSDYAPEESGTQQLTDPHLTEFPKNEKITKVWEELKQLQQVKAQDSDSPEEALKAARAAKDLISPVNGTIKATYAGQEVEVFPMKRGRKSLDKLIDEVNRNKNLNTIAKCQIDWGKFKETHHLEDKLAQNRKNGFIQRQEFLLKSREKQQKHILSLKRKKP